MTVEEDRGTTPQRSPKLASISRKGLLTGDMAGDEENGVSPSATPGRRMSSTPTRISQSPNRTGVPLKSNLNKFLTPSATFARLREEKEEVSKLTPTPVTHEHSFRDGFTLPLIGEVKPKILFEFVKTWLKNPKNLALLLWGIAVAVSGAILFMVMVGMLDHVIPKRKERDTWFEVSNQIINALFTLMCLYLHPHRCLHLHLLWRWRPEDIIRLRGVYCKNGTRKPNEWFHMLVVVMLLQLNCFAQYALCGLNWGYRRDKRPAIGVAICLCTSFGAGAAAGIYNSVSPLGRDFELEPEDALGEVENGALAHESEFVPHTGVYRLLERRKSFATREHGSVVEKPVWKGGLWDVTIDPPVSILSTLCCVFVFGWNMDRLGFGNRYVHIATFILICTAPFWIFDLAALNIQNRYVRHGVGGTGIALCAFGLFYGGYWRIRMRERFKLPGNRFCCGKPNVTDCFQWLFFPLCSLCQEVRTAEYYDIKDDMFYSPNRRLEISPLRSPHTPAATFPSIQEMPQALHDGTGSGVEMGGHTRQIGDSHQARSPMSFPVPMTMTSMSSNSPTTATTRASPLRPEVFSRGSSPLGPARQIPSSSTVTNSELLRSSPQSTLHLPQFPSATDENPEGPSAQLTDQLLTPNPFLERDKLGGR